MITIRSWSGRVIHESAQESIALALTEAHARDAVLTGAVLTGADLTGANLTRANLTDADLTDAVLTDADLTGAVLTGAVLTGAVLTGAVLTGANLTRANLTDADLMDAVLTGAVLRGANLTDANLTRANLTRAVLRGADLRGADLSGANLTGAVLTGAVLMDAYLRETRDDVRAILDAAPHEVAGLRLALVEGRVAGSVYEGECACLLGTIANLRGVAYTALATPALAPNSSRPAERFFLAIHKGLTPETWPPSRLAVQWIDEWMAERAATVAL